MILGNTVTVMSPEGKPIQVSSSALQAAAAQNAVGRWLFYLRIEPVSNSQELSLILKDINL